MEGVATVTRKPVVIKGQGARRTGGHEPMADGALAVGLLKCPSRLGGVCHISDCTSCRHGEISPFLPK